MSTAVQMELEHNNTNSNSSGPETNLNDQVDHGDTLQESKELNNCHSVKYSDCSEQGTAESALKQNDLWPEKSTSEEGKSTGGPQVAVDQESADYFKNQGNEHLKSKFIYK